MNPNDLYLEAHRRGLRLVPAGDKLAVFPKGRCPPDFADTLRQHKAALLAWLTAPPCPGWCALPPDDLPLGTIPPCPSAVNRERVIRYMRRQTGDCPGPLCAWMVNREEMYYAGPGRPWDCGQIVYAAARDAATWQLKRSERQVWAALAGFDEVASLQ